MTTLAPLALIEAISLSAPVSPIRSMVCLTSGGEAVDDSAVVSRVPADHLAFRRDVQRQSLVSIAPFPASSQPGDRLSTACRPPPISAFVEATLGNRVCSAGRTA